MRRGREMTEDGLNRLLAALGDDREQAAELYLHLHGKLVRYFAWHYAAHPEALADEALDRTARRLSEGERVENPVSYVLGVARRVLLEQKPRPPAQGVDEALLSAPAPAGADHPMECLERCLDQLPPETQALLMEYYSADAAARIAVRQRMADRMGLALNALRNRVMRLRQNLEHCVTRCLTADGCGEVRHD